MPTTLRDVRFRGQSGKHMLALSFSGFDPERTLDHATESAGDALGQCEIPLGPKSWLVRLNHQRGVQLEHSSYKFTAVAALARMRGNSARRERCRHARKFWGPPFFATVPQPSVDDHIQSAQSLSLCTKTQNFGSISQ
jgi:hypothetical protein